MARGPAPDKRRKLEERRRQIDEQLRVLAAREKEAERKQDTRRKIVAGGIVLAHAERHPEFADYLRAVLDQHVTRPMDRALFDLPPKPERQLGQPANDGEAAEPPPIDPLRESFDTGQQSGPSARTAGDGG